VKDSRGWGRPGSAAALWFGLVCWCGVGGRGLGGFDPRFFEQEAEAAGGGAEGGEVGGLEVWVIANEVELAAGHRGWGGVLWFALREVLERGEALVFFDQHAAEDPAVVDAGLDTGGEAEGVALAEGGEERVGDGEGGGRAEAGGGGAGLDLDSGEVGLGVDGLDPLGEVVGCVGFE